jgi:pimeloyl-ACP methyl ester carboxylesterase
MRQLIACSLLAVLLAGCSSGPGDGATSPAATPGTTSTPGAGADINDRYDVGGYELSITCSGTGSATVVYLHGLGGEGSDVNEAIAPRLAGRVRLCTYDRVNVAQSDDQSGRHSGAESVQDLHALLAAAKVEGPYLLLGFSFGGLLAAMYTGTYPDDVMGILMLDASLPTDDEVDALIPADQRPGVKADQEANPERVDFYRTLDQAEGPAGFHPRCAVDVHGGGARRTAQ